MARARKSLLHRILEYIQKLELGWSESKRIDGLWLGILEDEYEPIFQQVEAALCLIKEFDRVRYDRLTRDLDRIWVKLVSSEVASYDHSLNACMLNTRFVLAETTSVEEVAVTIVHEATHARLMNRGIGYEEDSRSRVEAVCIRRELAFAARLPNGEQLCNQAEEMLELCDENEYWTNAALAAKHVEGQIEVLRQLGVPNYLIRILLAVRALMFRDTRQYGDLA